MNVKRILVSQPKPENNHSSYESLALKYDLSIDFVPFIQIAPVSYGEFRKQNISIPDHSAVILTSRHATDHFFRLCEELKIEPSQDMKYFCATPLIANYLQKFTILRKRKVFTGGKLSSDLFPLFTKHHDERYLYPTSQNPQKDITDYLGEQNIKFSMAQMYQIVSSDLSDVVLKNYDMVVFFSSADIYSFSENFPDFQQGKTLLAGYGATTCKAIRDVGLKSDIEAPIEGFPSMTGTLDYFFNSRRG